MGNIKHVHTKQINFLDVNPWELIEYPVVTAEDTESTVVSALITKDCCILVQDHVKSERLTIPSGKVDAGENIYEAMVRELQEELGPEAECFVNPNPLTYSVRVAANGLVIHDYMFSVDVKGTIINAEPTKHKWQGWVPYAELNESSADPITECLSTALIVLNRQ